MLPSISRRAKLSQILVVLLLLLAAAEFVWRGPVRFVENTSRVDLQEAYFPSRAWVRGWNPYSPDNFRAISQEATGTAPGGDDIWAYSPLPPNTLALFSPLATLPWRMGKILWMVVDCAAVFAMILALSSLAGLVNWPQKLLLAALLLLLAPLQTGVAVGNPSIPAIGCIVLAVWAAANRKDVLAAILLAVGATLKPQLGLWFLLYYMLGRRWRIAFLGAGISALVLIVAVTRLELAGVNWLTDYLSNAHRFAEGCPTCTFTDRDPIRFTLINLQVLAYSFVKNAFFANTVAFGVGGVLIAVWAWLAVRATASAEFLAVTCLAILNLLPAYHRNYDATLLIFPLAWTLSAKPRHFRVLSRAMLVMMLPFAVPGPAMLQGWASAGRIPSSIANSWAWGKIIMPHEVWLLLMVSLLLLYGLAMSPMWGGHSCPPEAIDAS